MVLAITPRDHFNSFSERTYRAHTKMPQHCCYFVRQIECDLELTWYQLECGGLVAE